MDLLDVVDGEVVEIDVCLGVDLQLNGHFLGWLHFHQVPDRTVIERCLLARLGGIILVVGDLDELGIHRELLQALLTVLLLLKPAVTHHWLVLLPWRTASLVLLIASSSEMI
jgi:hypothetical protein